MLYNESMRIGLCVRALVYVRTYYAYLYVCMYVCNVCTCNVCMYVCINSTGAARISHTLEEAGGRNKLTRFEYSNVVTLVTS